jgi:chemotaxis protein CheX
MLHLGNKMEHLQAHVKPFVEIIVKTFKSFVQCDAVAGKPCFSSQETNIQGDISVIIGITGKIRGLLLISMEENLAIKLTDNIVGTVHTDIDADVTDALGEIANIIAGNIKQVIPEGERLRISLPTLIKGTEHSVSWDIDRTEVLYIPFTVFDDALFHFLWVIETVQGA